MVCDVAMSRVREYLQEPFGEEIQYPTVDGKGTLVQASSPIDFVRFQSVTREAIAASQDPSRASLQSEEALLAWFGGNVFVPPNQVNTTRAD